LLSEEERLRLFLSSAARLSGFILIRGFASQPHDWFALIGKDPSSGVWTVR